MSLREGVVNAIIRITLRIICRLDARELERIPAHGPGILLANHTTYVEGPMFYVLLQPRKTTALAKRELWRNPFTCFFMKTWKVIPITRGRVDSNAMRAALRALDDGMFLGIAAEGTRSRNGVLTRGHAGVTYFATERHVPVYPLVQWGLVDLRRNLKRLRRTPVTIRVGAPFYVRTPENRRIASGERRIMIDEMMYQLALLLPEPLRGCYGRLELISTEYLEFC